MDILSSQQWQAETKLYLNTFILALVGEERTAIDADTLLFKFLASPIRVLAQLNVNYSILVPLSGILGDEKALELYRLIQAAPPDDEAPTLVTAIRAEPSIAASARTIFASLELEPIVNALFDQYGIPRHEGLSFSASTPFSPPIAEASRPALIQFAGAGGTTSANSISIGDVVGNSKIVYVFNQFFGGEADNQQIERLNLYLDTLIDECQRMRLSRLTGRAKSGAEQDQVPDLRLQSIYTSLITDGPPVTVLQREHSLRELQELASTEARKAYDCPGELVESTAIRIPFVRVPPLAGLTSETRQYPLDAVHMPASFPQLAPDQLLTLHVERPELGIEAALDCSRLVLLGEPGAGKSTLLRYIALLLALRLRGHNVDLPGWPLDVTPIPVLCPLAQVARVLSDHNYDADAALHAVLASRFEGIGHRVRPGLSSRLAAALHDDSLILLFDGLDEVPVAEQGPNPRVLIAAALRRLAVDVRARMVVSSRVLPYRSAPAWQLPADEGWQVRTLQPLIFGQVRTFVHNWYRSLIGSSVIMSHADAQERADTLIHELAVNARLRPLVRSPLLLTMLAILHYNKREVPRDRAKLYDECVQLLLERWEQVRQPFLESGDRGLIARLGLPEDTIYDLFYAQLRGVIHKLALQAHEQPPSDDGRGLIDGDRLRGQVLAFFQRLTKIDPDKKVDVFVQVLREDAGLLMERDDGSYVFPHLTFQEYLAACALADLPQPDMLHAAYRYWLSKNADHWREVLLLMVGRLRQQGEKALVADARPWLQLLVSSRPGGSPKAEEVRRRDALLAGLSYNEIGRGQGFANSALVDVEAEIESPLRLALCDLLEVVDPAIGLSDRIGSAMLLGAISDPRLPVQPAQWEEATTRVTAPPRRSERTMPLERYWCPVPAGRYAIGGWSGGDSEASFTLEAFWIARLPIGVEQFRMFVADGYAAEEAPWITAQFRDWRMRSQRSGPRPWSDLRLTAANQPVVGVAWFEAVAFAAWVDSFLRPILPDTLEVRLPSEAEWEAAATFAGPRRRQRNPWGDSAPNPDVAIFGRDLDAGSAPVGCCPGGNAFCGAQDMTGNVWEWTSSLSSVYPTGSAQQLQEARSGLHITVRGGAYNSDATLIGGTSRDSQPPSASYRNLGFRLVLGPRTRS